MDDRQTDRWRNGIIPLQNQYKNTKFGTVVPFKYTLVLDLFFTAFWLIVVLVLVLPIWFTQTVSSRHKDGS